MAEEFIGMGEAAVRLGVSEARVARDILQKAKVDLIPVTARTYAVRATDVEKIRRDREENVPKSGRPKGVKQSEETKAKIAAARRAQVAAELPV
ncbi:hypothetical protein [Armatimonas sp.]|uniref:hypothetical protein n=1 Tax=Armatimonas sp. TaxID=1872638 RepID=UPI00286C3412|nr:hypothetical protein [Armatimonas sp.]